ncbi:YuiF family protein, putative amino acid transporter [Arcobacter venerupis]|uniref:YuiF family protein, putative amino acid transporter n=1 Tax=Arcobacter venerupis TaxID=1054033 RepID=A0AAE7B900_9BACT|nr:Na+/H+ antiporter family protein [Arcobacter venerupis]QKF66831.1 YuiF family protein, putative amino acid transporter [Arcobacter venerupis]RWS49826.1 sodium:proton antiporter [Arcobacter venerupis]
MNSVIVAVTLMVILSLMRVNIVIALIIGAIVGGLSAGLGLNETIEAFNKGLGNGATIALSYAMLGTFAVAISKSGITDLLSNMIIKKVNNGTSVMQFIYIKYTMLALILFAAISSQNLVPVHIAFIPILIPPLLHSMAQLQLDRRVVACVMTFGLVATYMILPLGFGGIFLNEILLKNLTSNGIAAVSSQLPIAMSIPVVGMFIGLLIAILFTYRKKRVYDVSKILEVESQKKEINPFYIFIALISIATALGLQLYTDSIIIGSLAGFIIFIVAGVIKANETQDFFTKGLKMMGMIGFIMIAANGFASVINTTGGVETLVTTVSSLIADNKSLAVILMLLVGLFITMGIGSSFSTIPIIATIYAPLCLQLDFSVMATITIIGTAAALGDAGSPASDSTLGPTSGLNVDGQHDHIWDSVVPTFLHYNIPLILFGWFAAVYVF